MSFLIAAAHAATPSMPTVPPPGAEKEAFMLNLMLIVMLAGLFYVLLIMPQQKRFKKHREMLDQLRKGDKILTAGGLVGTVDKITEGSDEVVVDLGNGLKVTALRSTIQTRVDNKAA